jgi:uncharacterized ferredoxin-like protein
MMIFGRCPSESFLDDKTTIKHVDEVLKLLSVMSGDRRYEEIFAESRKGKVENMCEVAERLANQGRAEGENQMAKLIQLLLAAGRTEDAAAVASDVTVRNRLYREFGITSE